MIEALDEAASAMADSRRLHSHLLPDEPPGGTTRQRHPRTASRHLPVRPYAILNLHTFGGLRMCRGPCHVLPPMLEIGTPLHTTGDPHFTASSESTASGNSRQGPPAAAAPVLCTKESLQIESCLLRSGCPTQGAGQIVASARRIVRALRSRSRWDRDR